MKQNEVATQPKEKKMVKKSSCLSFASAVLVAMALGACNESSTGDEARSSAPEKAPPSTAEKAAPSAGATETLSADGRQSIVRALDAYEQVRAQLATDEVSDVTANAGSLEQAANAAAGEVPKSLRAHLESAAASSRALKEMSKDDADAVRRAFGDVSRAFVALLAAKPSLQQGRHVFECPMAQGYKKWIQPSDELSNPYMGTRMPKCGSESDWEADG